MKTIPLKSEPAAGKAKLESDGTAGVGVDAETPVSEDYTRASSKFTGTIDKVTISLKK